MTQLPLDFSETLKDADGDTVVVDRLSDTERIISRLLKCSRKKSREAGGLLHKEQCRFFHAFRGREKKHEKEHGNIQGGKEWNLTRQRFSLR